MTFKIYNSSRKTKRNLQTKIKNVLRSARNVKLPMKTYMGDRENNKPEFEEVAQSQVLFKDFLSNEDLWNNNQIKLQIADDSLWFEFEFLDAALKIMHEHKLSIHLDSQIVWRISGKDWKFPQHFDAINQYIVHLSGKKKWIVDGEIFVLEAGDILFLKMGTEHQAENLETSLILNFQYIPDGLEELNLELKKEFENRYPLRVSNINLGKDFRKSI